MDHDPREGAQVLLAQGGFTVWDLWIEFFSRGGRAGPFELDDHVYGIPLLSGFDTEVLDITVTELLTD